MLCVCVGGGGKSAAGRFLVILVFVAVVVYHNVLLVYIFSFPFSLLWKKKDRKYFIIAGTKKLFL